LLPKILNNFIRQMLLVGEFFKFLRRILRSNFSSAFTLKFSRNLFSCSLSRELIRHRISRLNFTSLFTSKFWLFFFCSCVMVLCLSSTEFWAWFQFFIYLKIQTLQSFKVKHRTPFVTSPKFFLYGFKLVWVVSTRNTRKFFLCYIFLVLFLFKSTNLNVL